MLTNSNSDLSSKDGLLIADSFLVRGNGEQHLTPDKQERKKKSSPGKKYQASLLVVSRFWLERVTKCDLHLA